MPRYCFSTVVKADKIEAYKEHHDNIWPEVAGGLRKAGITQLTTWQIPGTNRLVMYITTAGNVDLAAATGPDSEYRKDPVAKKWEELMCSFFEGGEWAQLDEIHASDREWNSSLKLPTISK